MPWTKKDYPVSMKNLEEHVKDKAIEIANRLVEEGYEDGRAIPIAISQAKQWDDKRGGEISTEITHHLTPEEGEWVLKAVEGQDRFVFDTKEKAMSKVEEMAKKKAMKVMVHDSDGKFQKVY